MNTVTIGVSSLLDARRRLSAAFRNQAQGDRISFENIELLWKVLAPKRWAILRAMAGQGPLAIREIARRVDRDVKAVHSDVHALLKAGVLERASGGAIVFPYDGVIP